MDDAKLRDVLAQMTEALKQANKEAYDAHLYAQELELALLRVPELSKRFEQERVRVHGSRDALPELDPLQTASKSQERLIVRLERMLTQL
jgi:hypothetical protein